MTLTTSHPVGQGADGLIQPLTCAARTAWCQLWCAEAGPRGGPSLQSQRHVVLLTARPRAPEGKKVG